MSEHTLHYGDISWTMPMADKNLAAVLESNPVSLPVMEPDQAVREALRHPIGSPCLKDIVSPGEKDRLLVPDVTRLWQSPAVYVHVMVEELNACGIPDSDILIVTATGTHRAHVGDEQARLLGEDICRRIRVVDHDCRDTAHLVHVGDTSRGTPVWFNSYAMACDKIIITCGVVYHFLAGFGGGGKMLLPGIAGYETIQRHHKQALNPGFGNGTNADVRSANMADSNIFHADIFEAAAMARPCFGLNVVVNDDYRILKAFAGDWVQSHAAACRLVDSMEGVTIHERTPLVVASAGGYPKDINLYQTIKLLSNALSAVQPGGTPDPAFPLFRRLRQPRHGEADLCLQRHAGPREGPARYVLHRQLCGLPVRRGGRETQPHPGDGHGCRPCSARRSCTSATPWTRPWTWPAISWGRSWTCAPPSCRTAPRPCPSWRSSGTRPARASPAGREAVKNSAGSAACKAGNPASPELARALANCLSWRRVAIFDKYFKLLKNTYKKPVLTLEAPLPS